MYLPMAGEEVSPGDSIPAALNSLSPPSSSTKSWRSLYARTPANDVIVSPSGNRSHIFFALPKISSNPSRRMEVSKVSSSTEVGPISVFPSVVGVTSTPFPAFVGTVKMVLFTYPAVEESSRIYSPFLACTVKFALPKSSATFCDPAPAQLITYFALTLRPSAAESRTLPPCSSAATTSKSVKSSAPLSIALPIAAIVSVNGQTMPPVGAYSAAKTSLETFGSRRKTSSLFKISRPFTPLFFPRSTSSLKVFSCSSSNASTREALFLYSTPSSLHTVSIIALPSTLNFAFKLPSAASNPA